MKYVLTTGTFDLIHYGHINLLKKAKEMGNYLIVGLNVTKNGNKTYYSYEERKSILEAIRYVDKVVPIEKQEDKYKWLKEVDIFAIGSDYIGYKDIEEIRKYAEVKFIERTPGISSTQVKQYLSDNTIYNTYVIDLDDTICFTENRDFEHSKPNKSVIDKINELYDKGYKIVIATARRSKKLQYIRRTRKEIQKNNRELVT